MLRAIVAARHRSWRRCVTKEYRLPVKRSSGADMEGNWRAEQVFILEQALSLYDVYQAQLAKCEKQFNSISPASTANRI